jgi:hypothetical protein
MKNRQPFSLVVDRFENGSAVLTTADGTLVVPRDALPDKCQEGDVLGVDFFYLKDEKLRRENIARALLAEILGPKDNGSAA